MIHVPKRNSRVTNFQNHFFHCMNTKQTNVPCCLHGLSSSQFNHHVGLASSLSSSSSRIAFTLHNTVFRDTPFPYVKHKIAVKPQNILPIRIHPSSSDKVLSSSNPITKAYLVKLLERVKFLPMELIYLIIDFLCVLPVSKEDILSKILFF